MIAALSPLWRWLFPPPCGPAAMPAPDTRQLRIPLSVLQRLRRSVTPASRPEPLSLLHVRYVAEDRRTIAVAFEVTPMPDRAYVEGPDGANFDARWLFAFANEHFTGNVGLLLAHSHGGFGKPQFSGVDRRTNRDVMAKLAIGVETAPYGAILLSNDDQIAIFTIGARMDEAAIVVVTDALGTAHVRA